MTFPHNHTHAHHITHGRFIFRIAQNFRVVDLPSFTSNCVLSVSFALSECFVCLCKCRHSQHTDSKIVPNESAQKKNHGYLLLHLNTNQQNDNKNPSRLTKCKTKMIPKTNVCRPERNNAI